MTVRGNNSTAAVSSPTTPPPTLSFSITTSPDSSAPVTAASTRMVQCFAGSDQTRRGNAPYYRRLEKVKFGVPISEAFTNDIPATLLVLLLKVNKQGPLKKDIWRAPGNQAHVRKLIHVMQHGRLVNIENFSAYTAASVIKKFLTKLPGGIFGKENENRLFEMLSLSDQDKQREAFCRVVSSLPVPSQHLLALLVGTFRLIADAAESCGMKTSPDAIGVSVAPSLFHSCILDGHRAKMEDIARFHMASKVVSLLVQSFGCPNLFPRENYEFYARITGRTLRVDDNWRFTFQYPSNLVFHNTTAGPNGEMCCSSSIAGQNEGSEAAKNWLKAFLQHPSSHPGLYCGPDCSALNIIRSRSSPARVNPYLGICGELGGSWTELISFNPCLQQSGQLSGTRSITVEQGGGGDSLDENFSDRKASSCEHF